jgi:tetratricopeptide (TPR) repeat protein
VDVVSQVGQALLTAVLLPVGVLVSLVCVRAAVAVRGTFRRSRPLPIVVHPLNFEHDMREFVPNQRAEMLELPSRLRDFISDDSIVGPRLSPGPVSPIAPGVSAATPGKSDTPSWSSFLLELVFPQARPAYNLILVPEVPEGGYAVGSQVVKTPGNRLISARSFRADTMAEMVLQIGSFCIENVLEQPAVLRRSPRWEHWHAGAYLALRRALQQRDIDDDVGAHVLLNEAASLAPGNARTVLYHGSLHEAAGEYAEAVTTYNAAMCLWPQNVDLSYRLAGAMVNHAIGADADAIQTLKLVREANRILKLALARVAPVRVIRRTLSTTFNLRRRDLGERRYWFAWLRPDRYRAPLRFLRRTKGYEYRCALRVSIASNEMLLHAFDDSSLDEIRSVSGLFEAVREIVERKRSGWLAHWSAACFFSRAMAVSRAHRPDPSTWAEDASRVAAASSSRIGELFLAPGGPSPNGQLDDWKRYCSQLAIRELGRVLRNPCNQLDTALLWDDPDMVRLKAAAGGRSVAVIAGLGPRQGSSTS